MAGIGVKLNNIYGKNTLTTDVIGMGYSTVMTIARECKIKCVS